MPQHRLLLFGVTGYNGRYILEKAVNTLPNDDYNIVCVRNPRYPTHQQKERDLYRREFVNTDYQKYG
jgi:hypothetical protein